MKKLLFICLLLLIGIGLLTQSQAFWQSRDSNYDISISTGTGGESAGVGDLGITGIQQYWGLRCFKTSSTGNVADIWDAATGSTTETLLVCSGSGGTILQTINPLSVTCLSGCKVKILYDQSGIINCTNGTLPCDLSQATNANRPTFTQNCLGVLPCITWNGGSQNLLGINMLGGNQPYTISWVAERTGLFTSTNTVIGTNSGGVRSVFITAANRVAGNAGIGSAQITAADNAWHSVQMVFNAASSEISVDGTGPNTGLSMGAGAYGGGGAQPCMGGCGANLSGQTAEGSVWSGSFSNGTITTICHNQFTYWGTSTSC